MHPTFTRLIAGLAVATLVACGSPPPANTVTSVTIDGGDRTIVFGDPLTLTATVDTTGSASSTVTWSSSNETVATIDATTRDTASGVGTGT